MKYVNKILFALFLIAFTACESDEVVEEWKADFQLSSNAINFTSTAGKQSITISDVATTPKAKIISENSDWCSIKVKGGTQNDATLEVSVTENIKIKNRTAQIELVYQGRKKHIMILQAHKTFDYIAEINNVVTTPQPGAVELSWEDPVEDNFQYVIITVYDKDQNIVHKERVDRGVQQALIQELLSANGDYDFAIQSFDHENEPGKIVDVKCSALKRVAFKFTNIPDKQYVGYYFKDGDIHSTRLSLGSNEFNENEEIIVKIEQAPELLAQYNSEHSTDLQPLPENAYTTEDILFTGTEDFQEISVKINTSALQDRTIYGLPIRIADASGKEIDSEQSTAMLVYHVDDLEGWYTVERLPKCGEGPDNYPEGGRRFIKRTGDTTWETGYLFRGYSSSEDSPGSIGSIQFITIDPSTKELHIQQGSYDTAEDNNVFDPKKQELHIEYLYAAWSGWWTHERMFNRSCKK